MDKVRRLAVPALVLALGVLLVACTPATPSPEGRWSGTDSAGNAMTFVLNEDGTVEYEDFAGGTPEAPGDSWEIEGTTVTLVMVGVPTGDGTVTTITYEGENNGETIEFAGTGEDSRPYTLDVTRVTPG